MIPDRASAFSELFKTLRPGGMLAVVELIFDPHFQSRRKATEMAVAAGFRESAFFGHRFAYVIHFQKQQEWWLIRKLSVYPRFSPCPVDQRQNKRLCFLDSSKPSIWGRCPCYPSV